MSPAHDFDPIDSQGIQTRSSSLPQPVGRAAARCLLDRHGALHVTEPEAADQRLLDRLRNKPKFLAENTSAFA